MNSLAVEKRKAATPAASVPCFDTGIQGFDDMEVKSYRLVGPADLIFQQPVPSRRIFQEHIDFIMLFLMGMIRPV